MAEAEYRTPPGIGLRRPLPSDAPVLAALTLAAFGGGEDRAQETVERRARRLIDLAAPHSRVAETESGRLVGLAVSREIGPTTLLAWAVVEPTLQGRGILRAMLAGFPGPDAGVPRLILSSTDPKAMRRYALLGLPIHPTVGTAGILRPGAVAPAPGVEQVSPLEARALLDALGLAVRGAAYDADVDLMAAQGDVAHVVDHGPGNQAVVIRHRAVVRIAVASSAHAGRLALRGALLAAPAGATVHLSYLRAGQDWAISEVMAAGLPLSPDGPIFADQPLHPLHIPNGSLG